MFKRTREGGKGISVYSQVVSYPKKASALSTAVEGCHSTVPLDPALLKAGNQGMGIIPNREHQGARTIPVIAPTMEVVSHGTGTPRLARAGLSALY